MQLFCCNCNCNSDISHKRKDSKFCTRECSALHQKRLEQEKFINDWINKDILGYRSGYILSSHIRNFLLKKANFSCSKCSWDKINVMTKKCPLEINHIDGNAENCDMINLEVLCPNCHSLTDSYKSLNKGKGRTTLISRIGSVATAPIL